MVFGLVSTSDTTEYRKNVFHFIECSSVFELVKIERPDERLYRCRESQARFPASFELRFWSSPLNFCFFFQPIIKKIIPQFFGRLKTRGAGNDGEDHTLLKILSVGQRLSKSEWTMFSQISQALFGRIHSDSVQHIVLFMKNFLSVFCRFRIQWLIFCIFRFR